MIPPKTRFLPQKFTFCKTFSATKIYILQNIFCHKKFTFCKHFLPQNGSYYRTFPVTKSFLLQNDSATKRFMPQNVSFYKKFTAKIVSCYQTFPAIKRCLTKYSICFLTFWVCKPFRSHFQWWHICMAFIFK